MRAAKQATKSGSSNGAAYVFLREGPTWRQEAYLKASNTELADGECCDEFGYAVAISENIVVVGAWNEDSYSTGINGNGADNSFDEAGAAYVLVRTSHRKPSTRMTA